jgi:hypothetical protein
MAKQQKALLVTVRRGETHGGWEGLEEMNDVLRQEWPVERITVLGQEQQMFIALVVLEKKDDD